MYQQNIKIGLNIFHILDKFRYHDLINIRYQAILIPIGMRLYLYFSMCHEHLVLCDYSPYLSPMLTQRYNLPLNGPCQLPQSSEYKMGDILRFNSKLSSMDSNVHQSYNFLALMQLLSHLSRNSVCTRMNWFAIRFHHLEINWHWFHAEFS
jgi:hypothetical protein